MFLFLCVLVAVPPVVPELLSDDDATHFDDIPEPDSGEEFFPIPKVHKIKRLILFVQCTNCQSKLSLILHKTAKIFGQFFPLLMI